MKRYALFCMFTYYPSGGWSDFHGTFDTIDEANKRAHGLKQTLDCDHWHIADLTTGEMVDDFE